MSTAKAKYLIVISYDAFSEDNYERASKLPNLAKLIKNGAYTKELKSVYPTLTYVVHTTMVTGVYPDKHGIYHNCPLQPFVDEKDQEWFWFNKDIKVPTIYDSIKNHGMKTAGLLWPVTGKASINYNIPEVKAVKNENQAFKVLKNGSPLFIMSMEKKFGKLRRGTKEPYLDDYTSECAAYTIKRKMPNLLLVHLIDLDDAKHENGTNSVEVEEAIIRMDRRLGDIIDAVNIAGIMDETVFLVLGDHGQINVKYKVKLNKLFKDKGLIYEENGEMKWRAYLQSTGGSAYLYIKENDIEAEELALSIINKAISDNCYGIEGLYDESINPEAKYMLEAKRGYSFDDGITGEVLTSLEEKNIKYATHGYSPNKDGYKCNLIISGNCIKKGYPIGEVDMVDIAPTIASILGVDFNNCEGKSINEVFL